MRKHAFEDGDVVKLDDGAVGIYSGDDWLGLAAPAGKVWVVIDGDVAAVDPSEINKFGGRSAMRTEAEIVRDLEKAEGLAEQRELVRELDLFRQGRTAAVQADRDIDIANAFIRDTLTPVLPYQHHTAATDWIEEEAAPTGPYDHQMRVEATMWFKRVSDEVKADREEFGEQAQGMARRVSGQYGLQAEAAFHAFLETVARLHRQGADDVRCRFCGVTLHGEPPYGNCLGNPDGATHQASLRRRADDKPGEVDVEQSGNAESAVTDYDTKDDQEPFLGEDWEDPEHAGVHPEMPGAGEGSRENEPRPEKTEGSRRRKTAATCSCAHYDDGSVGTTMCPLHANEDPCWTMARVTGKRRRGSIVNGVCTNCGWTARFATGSRTAAEGQTCDVCGDSIEKDPSGEDPQTWHHNNGEKHDHEAKPSSDSSKESRKTAMESYLEKHWYSQGYDRGADDRAEFAESEGINPDDYSLTSDDYMGNPLSGEMAGQSIPEIFGSWDNATQEAQDAYEEGYEDGFQGNTRQASLQKRADVQCATCGHEFWDHLAVPGPPLGMVGRCRFGDCEQFVNEDTIEAGASLRKQARPLYEIADEIRADWSNVYFGAVPYLDALSSLDSISDAYGYDSGDSIVAYFLSNATTWRGEKAREIKAELNKMLKGGSKTAAEGQTCSKCGDSIERDPEGEEPRTWHHTSGGSHDHEAEPGSDDSSKESRRRVAATPAWLSERNNDPYGTPSNHEFWGTVDFEDIGDMRIFEKDGKGYLHHRRQNYWMNFGSLAEAREHAGTTNQSLDPMWASRRTAGIYCKTHDVWIGEGNEANHDEACDKEQRATEKTKDARRTAGVSLTNVGIEGPGVGKGKDSSGNEVRFKLSAEDEKSLKGVLYSDLAVNFSGVTVDDADIIS